jgi:hypothetical protein
VATATVLLRVLAGNPKIIRRWPPSVSTTRRVHKGSHRPPEPQRLKNKLRPIRGLRTDKTAQVIIAGHAFMQNLRRGHYELAADAPPATRVAAAFTELAQAI